MDRYTQTMWLIAMVCSCTSILLQLFKLLYYLS